MRGRNVGAEWIKDTVKESEGRKEGRKEVYERCKTMRR